MSTLVNLPMLINLALGTPEVGAVNFNILHSLLHVFVRMTKLSDTQVEFRGEDAARIDGLLKAFPNLPDVKVSAYTLPSLDKPKPSKDKKRPPKKEEVQTVVVVEGPQVSPTSSTQAVIVSKDKLDTLEDKVTSIEDKLSAMDEMPSNQDLLDRTRSSNEATPVNDMWQIVNVKKRMDAAELAITKLSSVIEDLAKQTGHDILLEQISLPKPAVTVTASGTKPEAPHEAFTGADDEVKDRIISMEKRMWDMENRLGVVEQRGGKREQYTTDGGASDMSSGINYPKEPVSYEGLSLDETVVAIRGEITSIRSGLDEVYNMISNVKVLPDEIPPDRLIMMLKDIENIKNKLDKTGDSLGSSKGYHDDMGERGGHETKIQQLEEKITNVNTTMQGIETNVSGQMENLQQQISDMEKELGVFLERLNTDMPIRSSTSQDFSGLSELYNKIQVLQNDIDNLNNTATRLLDDRDERQMHINALLEQIELLKIMKADKEDLDDALADKADHNVVNRKVSHDQFDAACDDLSKGLEEAFGKLTQQEAFWQQALDDIQHEIDNKLDRVEISPLKDFVNAKLKSLHDKLKELAAIRKDIEAAGTKKKLLRNVNCISCDQNVVMKMENEIPLIPASEGLPPTKSMRPYLTYELDMLRKQQKTLPISRNLNDYEDAMKAEKRGKGKMPPGGTGKERDHLCNRYCGGSHTVTTPTQRVTRTGHFQTQFGPQVIQLVEGGVKGTDGKIYKASSIPPSSPRKVSVSTSPIVIPGLESSLLGDLVAADSTPRPAVSKTVSPQTTSPRTVSPTSSPQTASPRSTSPKESHKKLPSSGSSGKMSHKSGMKAASLLLSEVIQAGIGGHGAPELGGDGHLEAMAIAAATADALASQAISEHLQELERVTQGEDSAPQE